MDALPNVGRYLFATPMAVFGLLHFMHTEAMAAMVPIPGGVVWVYLMGAARSRTWLLGAQSLRPKRTRRIDACGSRRRNPRRRERHHQQRRGDRCIRERVRCAHAVEK